MEKREKNRIQAKDYLETESAAEYKSEYYHGEAFAMTGASFNHNLIATNIASALHLALKESGCFVLSSDMKIQVDREKHYAYPDISVICGDVEFANGRDDAVANPIVIVEILSESTKDYDRGTKFAAYRGIKSLRDYIVVDQYEYRVEHYHKNDIGQWVLDDYKKLNEFFSIRSVKTELSLATIYYRVKTDGRRS